MLRTRKGEGYIDTVVLVLIFTMLVVVLLQLFSAVFLSQKLHAVAEETARYAAACGEIGADVTTYNNLVLCKNKSITFRQNYTHGTDLGISGAYTLKQGNP